jgi:Replication-relaxation
MTNCFPKNDLARLLALPAPLRLVGLLAAFRFLAVPDLTHAGVDSGETGAAEAASYTLRFRLQRRMTDATPAEVLALSRAGARELARAMEVDPTTVPHSTRSNSTRSTMFMDHTLARNSFALALGAALAATEKAPKLLSWEHDRDRLSDAVTMLHGPAEFRRQALEADGLAVVSGPRGPEGLLVEIDRGTETPGYLGKKFAGYLEWWKLGGPRKRFGVGSLRILTIAPDERRTIRLRDACAVSTGGKASGLFWFAAEDEIGRAGILTPVWSTLRGEKARLWCPSA